VHIELARQPPASKILAPPHTQQVGLLPEATRVVTFMFVLATYTCTVGALTTALTALCRTSSATTLAMNIILLM
jgi:hypothetical protein